MSGSRMSLEFSRRIPAGDVPDGGRSVRLAATEEERNAVARRLGTQAVERLEAWIDLVPGGPGIVARGRYEADVIQTCVVTLEPVRNHVAGDFEQRFMPAAVREPGSEPAGPGAEIEVDPLSEDPPEPLREGAAELGELVVEHLALGLDPYPRAPKASVDLPHETAENTDNPFAKLRDVKFSATES